MLELLLQQLDNALMQKYLVPPSASICYFNDYGLYEFFREVSNGTFFVILM